MASYFFECKEREAAAITAVAANEQVKVPAEVFKAGLDERIFATIHFLKAYEDNYNFDARSTYDGFLANVTSKFLDWRKSFVLIRWRNGL